jgi:hypothetical protein
MNNYIYLILEFNASKRYSHHWSYVDKYRKFLENLNEPYEIWIPKNAQADILSSLGENCKTVLKSNVYGFERNENFYQWFVVKIIDLFLSQCKDKISSQKFEILKKYFSNLYTYAPYKRIKSMSNSHVAIRLVFPTTDSISFRLVERCLKQGIPIEKICFRLGSGYKDNFKVDNIEKKLHDLIAEFPECSIVLGYETHTHMQELLDKGLKSNNLFWTPAPPSNKSIEYKKLSRVPILGFLGVARPNKGFIEIPKLIGSLISYNIAFKAIAQEAIYPWNEYKNSILELEHFSEFLTILPANISEQELEDLFKSIDILVLPYSNKDYKLAGSGLLFTAADFRIPTLTKKGVAFEWDINEYSIGFTYENSEDFVSKIKYIVNQKNDYGFELYNADRNLAIKKFLEVKNVSNHKSNI